MPIAALIDRSRHVDPLEVFPPDGERDPVVQQALDRLGEKFADAVDKARDLVRDSGITLDIERLRDRVERRFGGVQRLVLSQPGVLHHLLLGAVEADELRRDEEELAREREKREQRREREREQQRLERERERKERTAERKHQQEESARAEARHELLAKSITSLIEQNGELLKLLIGRDATADDPPGDVGAAEADSDSGVRHDTPASKSQDA